MPKKSNFKETMKTLTQEQDYAEKYIQKKAKSKFNLIHQEIQKFLKDDKHNWIKCNFEDCYIGDTHYVLELCLEKKILKKLICFVQYVNRVKYKTVFFV